MGLGFAVGRVGLRAGLLTVFTALRFVWDWGLLLAVWDLGRVC